MRTVDIGIGHDDYLVIAELRYVEIFTDPGAQRRDNRFEFVVVDHFIDPRLFDVEHFAPQRKDGLPLRIAAFFGRTACGIALNDVHFAFGGIFRRTIGKFARKTETVETAFTPRRFFCPPSRNPRARFSDRFFEDLFQILRMLFEKERQFFFDEGIDDRAHFAVAELRFRLPFKLRFGHFER